MAFISIKFGSFSAFAKYGVPPLLFLAVGGTKHVGFAVLTGYAHPCSVRGREIVGEGHRRRGIYKVLAFASRYQVVVAPWLPGYKNDIG